MIKKTPQTCIFEGHVMHKRMFPFVHEFKYAVFSLLIDLDELGDIEKNNRFFSWNKFNLFSFYNRDHGARDGSDIKKWVIEKASEFGTDLKDGKVFCLNFPRIFGYVFNPLTVYFCYDRHHNLSVILYEVKNTFGEQHGYLINCAKTRKKVLTHSREKQFHVSPFIEMGCVYNFSVIQPMTELFLVIDQRIKSTNAPMLFAKWTGKPISLSNGNLLKTIIKFPLQNIKIISGIHWEALKLWFKGATFHKKPPPPSQTVS